MSGSTFGRQFMVSTWGESHGAAIGAVVDGCPAGLELCAEDIQRDLDRRKPGMSSFSTARKEDDAVEILSGIFEGKTTGTPICFVIYNRDQRSRDYGELANVFRPGHADYSYEMKYGIRDYRGGGRSSGRETAARVAAGAVAKKILAALGINISAYTLSIGPVEIDRAAFQMEESCRNPLCMPDENAYEKAARYLEQCREEGDSAGGVIECVVTGLKPGIGQPVFDKLDAALAGAVFSIGAVKGVEFGTGFAAALAKGSQNNDAFYADDNKTVKKRTNHAGGVLGGISDGSPLCFRAAIKPTPSIRKIQETVGASGQQAELAIHGRHDPVIVPRAVVVVEAMTALTLVDSLMQGMSSRMENLINIYIN